MIESVKKSRITPKGDDPGKYILDLTGEYIEPEIERTMATFMARALTDAVKMETKRVAELYIEANFPDLIKGVKPETVTNLALYYASQALALKLASAQLEENESGYCKNCRIGVEPEPGAISRSAGMGRRDMPSANSAPVAP